MSERIVVTGGRDFTDEQYVWGTLDNLHRRRRIVCVIHGGATGADACANRWAIRNNVERLSYPVTQAEWNEHGKKAGPMRNRLMLSREMPTLVVAYPGGRGTADCVKQAKQLGLLVADLRVGYVPQPSPTTPD